MCLCVYLSVFMSVCCVRFAVSIFCSSLSWKSKLWIPFVHLCIKTFSVWSQDLLQVAFNVICYEVRKKKKELWWISVKYKIQFMYCVCLLDDLSNVFVVVMVTEHKNGSITRDASANAAPAVRLLSEYGQSTSAEQMWTGKPGQRIHRRSRYTNRSRSVNIYFLIEYLQLYTPITTHNNKHVYSSHA